MSDLPDYTRRMTIIHELPEIPMPEIPLGLIPAGVYAVRGVAEKIRNPLTTEYLKQACILPSYTVVADPGGMMVSYEGGYAARALIFKAGVGEVALAKSCLDEFVNIQNADGSWYQQYRPERTAVGGHYLYEDLKVDSGASILIHAMADYDASIGPASVIYRAPVQLAFNFLRAAQLAHFNAHTTGMLANQQAGGVWNTAALGADCAEALLAALAALDQYGAGLLSQAGYSVATFANDLYDSMARFLWIGNGDSYYRTEYPPGEEVWGLPTVRQGISFTQALCANAIFAWAASPYLTYPNYSAQATKALDWITALGQGKWGGFYYAPIAPGLGKYYEEFPAYTAHVIMAYNVVNAARYAHHSARAIDFIRLCSLPRGEVFNTIHPNGRLEQGEELENAEGYMEFRCLNTALGLLAGA